MNPDLELSVKKTYRGNGVEYYHNSNNDEINFFFFHFLYEVLGANVNALKRCLINKSLNEMKFQNIHDTAIIACIINEIIDALTQEEILQLILIFLSYELISRTEVCEVGKIIDKLIKILNISTIYQGKNIIEHLRIIQSEKENDIILYVINNPILQLFNVRQPLLVLHEVAVCIDEDSVQFDEAFSELKSIADFFSDEDFIHEIAQWLSNTKKKSSRLKSK